MKDYDDTTQLKLNSTVLYTTIDEEAVILNTGSDKLYSVNGIGLSVLKLLESTPATIPTLLAHVMTHYNVEETICLRDVSIFIDRLIQEKLISIIDLNNENSPQ